MKKERKNILLYTIGLLISVFGSSIYTFAIGLYVLKETGSGMSFSLSLLFGFLPRIILLPIAGVFIERFDKKKIAVLMDSLNACLFIFTFILASINGLSLGLIYTSTLLTNMFTTIFALAMNVSRPQLVSKKNLISLNAKGNIIESLATICGPVIGGLVFALFNIRYFFLINGLSFLISAMIELAMDFNFNPIEDQKPAKKESFTQSLKEGIAHLRKSTTILKLIQGFAILNFVLAFAFNIANPIILTQYFELGANAYGFIQAFFPIGTIIGAMILEILNKKLTYGQIIKYSAFGEGIILIASAIPVLITTTSSPTMITAIYALLNMLLGLCISCVNIPIMYFVQTEVDASYRARVLSLGTTAANFTVPLGILLGGSIINLLPLYMLPLVGGAMSLIFLIPLLSSVTNLSME